MPEVSITRMRNELATLLLWGVELDVDAIEKVLDFSNVPNDKVSTPTATTLLFLLQTSRLISRLENDLRVVRRIVRGLSVQLG